MKAVRIGLTVLIIGAILMAAYAFLKIINERKILREVIERLSSDSRIAEVLVTKVAGEPFGQKTLTTIKFLEYDTHGNPLAPRYFTFSGNIIQFQSLVIRFDDAYVAAGHSLKGKSAYLFLKVFSLGSDSAEISSINEVNEVPSGYRTATRVSGFEKKLWRLFWLYALDPAMASRIGVKNAQIEAPGTRFIPGMLYTIKIEHDGGMRIDAKKLPEILDGERIDFQ
ncbi:MAG: hypothetical protein ABH865_03645 [Candidatus Omnitrophota bacterium]|nr:hypothetical protein [Candidatus Omnitrophota bacterium]